jgi:hypothetical protein
MSPEFNGEGEEEYLGPKMDPEEQSASQNYERWAQEVRARQDSLRLGSKQSLHSASQASVPTLQLRLPGEPRLYEKNKAWLERRDQRLEEKRALKQAAETAKFRSQPFAFSRQRGKDHFMRGKEQVDFREYYGLTFMPAVSHDSVYQRVAERVDREEQALAEVLQEAALAASQEHSGEPPAKRPAFRV